VLREWSIPRICAFLNVSRGRVCLAKYRISRMVKKELNGVRRKWV
jgi:hypothetical protein